MTTTFNKLWVVFKTNAIQQCQTMMMKKIAMFRLSQVNQNRKLVHRNWSGWSLTMEIKLSKSELRENIKENEAFLK